MELISLAPYYVTLFVMTFLTILALYSDILKLIFDGESLPIDRAVLSILIAGWLCILILTCKA